MERKKDPERKKKLRRYRIASVCAAVCTALIAYLRGFALENDWANNLAALCDGFFVSGVMFGGVGAMMWVSTTGFFDMLGYGIKNLGILLPFKRDKRYKRFYEYKEEQDAKRGKPQYFLLVIGVILIAIAGALLCFYPAA